jgi:hypothetical protein
MEYRGDVFMLVPKNSFAREIIGREAVPCKCPSCDTDCYLIRKLASMAMAKNPKMEVRCFNCLPIGEPTYGT